MNPQELLAGIDERAEARREKDFVRADTIRLRFELEGYELRDNDDGGSSVYDRTHRRPLLGKLNRYSWAMGYYNVNPSSLRTDDGWTYVDYVKE